MATPPEHDDLERQIVEMLTPEARVWLADLLHDYISPPVTNASIQAEIVLRAWDRMPEMALSEMQDLKGKLDGASQFLVTLIRTITPPAPESDDGDAE